MQVIRSCSNLPGFNLAAEEYLFSRRQDEILFLYVNEPCVVIGCNQALRFEVNTDYCSAHAVPIFRRLSGGGAVYHDKGNLNYCFIKNRIHGKYPLGAEFLQPVVQVLDELHIPVRIGQRKDLWLPGPKKISGTASHVGKDRELHHGTLLYDTDLEKLQKALSPNLSEKRTRAIPSVYSPVTNIRTYLSEHELEAPVAQDFFQLFIRKMQAIFQQDSISGLTLAESQQIQTIGAKTYESESWTYRR